MTLFTGEDESTLAPRPREFHRLPPRCLVGVHRLRRRAAQIVVPLRALDSQSELRDSYWMIITRICGIVMTAMLASTMATPVRPAEREIYPPPEQAAADLAAGLKVAAARHRRIILDFGGNWCTDCQVLDLYFHDAGNRPILDSSYVLVHVNIGHIDQNLDIAARYEIPLSKGVPALAVLDSDGKLLYSQKTGEFEAMRHMQSSTVNESLTRWKPGGST